MRRTPSRTGAVSRVPASGPVSGSALARDLDDRREAPLHVRVARSPRGDADAQARAAPPARRPTPAAAVGLERAGDAFGALARAEGHDHLVQLDHVQDLEARGREPLGEAAGVAAAARDE